MSKDEQIKNFMDNLGLSYEEALQLYLDDNSDIDTPEQKILTEKAKKNIKSYVSTEKKHTEKAKTRKVDTVKLEILQEVLKAVSGLDSNAEIEKEIGINFNFKNVSYTLKLVKHR